MFFNKGFYFLKGYVIIDAEGTEIERFINICLHRFIELKDLQYSGDSIRFKISAHDFKKLRPIARKTGTRIHIYQKRSGILDIKKQMKRWVFWTELAASLLIIILSSNFVWTVDIIGNDAVPEERIREALEKTGVYEGAFMHSIPAASEIKQRVLNDIPELSWIWVHKKGTKIWAEVRENVIPPTMLDRSVPCDIIAARDGLVTNIIAKNGETIVQENTAVARGDVVISGMVNTSFTEDAEPKYMYTHAEGEIYARTYHEKSGEYKLYYESRIPTGRTKTYNTVNVFSKSFDLFSDVDCGFEEYDISEETHELKIFGYYTGFSVKTVTYTEVSVAREPIPEETAVEIGKAELEEKISKNLLAGAVKKDESVKTEYIDEETIKVTLEMEFEEEIGTQAPLKVRE